MPRDVGGDTSGHVAGYTTRSVVFSSACGENFASLRAVWQWAWTGGGSIPLFGGDPARELYDFSSAGRNWRPPPGRFRRRRESLRIATTGSVSLQAADYDRIRREPAAHRARDERWLKDRTLILAKMMFGRGLALSERRARRPCWANGPSSAYLLFVSGEQAEAFVSGKICWAELG